MNTLQAFRSPFPSSRASTTAAFIDVRQRRKGIHLVVVIAATTSREQLEE
jgi:hypothetical protein